MTRFAFIKYGGLAAGGTERLLQEIAVELVGLGFRVDYFFCEPKISPGSSWIHPPNDPGRREFLESSGVKLVEFSLEYKDLSDRIHPWVSTNFFEVFNKDLYEMAWTAKAGPKEYPFHLLGIPFVEVVTLDAGFDDSKNRIKTILISNWQKNRWLLKGGDPKTSSILPLTVASQLSISNLRSQLGIPKDSVVLGFHQRVDDEIVSPIPFEAISHMSHSNLCMVIMGGGNKYREFAKELNMPVFFHPHNSDWREISRFLKTLDIYTHGRADGETFGTVLAEAMMYGIPIISHHSAGGSNAHVETIANGGFFTYSVAEYASVLDALIRDSVLRTRLGNNGRKFAEDSYSNEAFKVNIKRFLTELGIAKKFVNGQIEKHSTPLAPIALSSTRVLLHGLSDSVLNRCHSHSDEVHLIYSILRRLDLHKPTHVHATGCEYILTAVEIVRGLPNHELRLHSNEIEWREWICKLLEINGLIDYQHCSEKSFCSEKEDLLILKFYNEEKNLSKRISSSFIRSQFVKTPPNSLMLYLFLPIRKNRKIVFRQKKVLICHSGKSGKFLRVKCARFQIQVIVEVVSQVCLEWLSKKRLMRRLKHLAFLLEKSIKT